MNADGDDSNMEGVSGIMAMQMQKNHGTQTEDILMKRDLLQKVTFLDDLILQMASHCYQRLVILSRVVTRG